MSKEMTDLEIQQAARIKELEVEVEQVKLDLHAELRGNAAMRMRLGAKEGETMFAFTDRLIAERDTLRQQLSEAQALIEASRKQEAAGYFIAKRQTVFGKVTEWEQVLDKSKVPLYAAPVVAPDVLTRLEKAENNVRNATNVIQSILNGKTSPMLAQQVVNALNEFLDSTTGGANE